MNPNTDPVPFSRPELGLEEEQAVIEVLRSGWLTTGSRASRFEEDFRTISGSPFALAVNSATAGLHLALEALGIGPGDYVITSPYTFTATAEVIRYRGAHPLFVDIEEESWNIDPLKIEETLKQNRNKPIKAIIPVHIGGLPCKMHRINNLAAKYGLVVVEDAAHSFPVKTPEGFCGTTSDIGVYSFYANKTITTGEGGMIVTSQPALAERMRLMRLHGIDRDVWNRYTDTRASWVYDIVDAGYKYNMTDIAAAIGVEQLKKAYSLKDKRTRLARNYRRLLQGIPGLILPPEATDQAWHLFMILLDERISGVTRDTLAEGLSKRGIGVSLHYIPLHLMTYYRELYQLKPEDFPVSLRKYQQGLSLPLFPAMTENQQERVVREIRSLITVRASST